jgi:hypothetical protein
MTVGRLRAAVPGNAGAYSKCLNLRWQLERFSYFVVLGSALPAIGRLKGPQMREGTTVPNLLLEDLDMERISNYFRQFSRGFDHLLNSLDRRSSHLLFSTRSFGRAFLKRVPQLRSKLSSLAGKVAAKMTTTSR